MRIAVLLAVPVVAAAAQMPGLPEVLAKAAGYATSYEQRFSGLVAEEHYVQEFVRQTPSAGGNLTRDNPGGGFTAPRSREQRRTLRSEYLLVRLEGGGGWMPFRDVFEVDGRKIHDREDRLAALFLKPGGSSLDQAARIMNDSTRHNLGSVTRTINIPTLAILFLLPDISRRFEFTHNGEEAVAGRTAWKIDYREVQRPTLIRTSAPARRGPRAVEPNQDLPMRGTLWVDPANGTVLKTKLIAADAFLTSEISVSFREEPALQLWVPERMDEFYRSSGDERDITGTATYTKYRKFGVTTDEAVRKPGGTGGR